MRHIRVHTEAIERWNRPLEHKIAAKFTCIDGELPRYVFSINGWLEQMNDKEKWKYAKTITKWNILSKVAKEERHISNYVPPDSEVFEI